MKGPLNRWGAYIKWNGPLAQKGARVILACRSLKRGDKAASEIRSQVENAQVAVYFLDLSSLNSVRKFVQDFVRTENGLHILINNAGIYGCPHWKSENGYEMQFAVNHLGHFLLTNLLMDTLAQSAPSRILVVTSSLHKRGCIEFDDLLVIKIISLEKRMHKASLQTCCLQTYGGPQVSRQQFEMYTVQHLYYTATSALNVHGNFENPRQL